MKLQFGKYKGIEICDVAESDLSYLKWLEEQDWIDKFGIRPEIQHEIEKRTSNRPNAGFVKPSSPIK